MHAKFPSERVGNMKMDTLAFLSFDDLLVTESKRICFEIISRIDYADINEVVDEDDDEVLDEPKIIQRLLCFYPYCVIIKRVGYGLTADDFHIYLPIPDTDNTLTIITEAEFSKVIGLEKENFIIFENVNIKIVDPEEEDEETEEKLRMRMEEAAKNQEFERATFYRKKLERLTGKPEREEE